MVRSPRAGAATPSPGPWPLPPRALVGMVHLGALPGTPSALEPVAAIARRAADEALILARAGFDAVLIENMHDLPYLMGRQGPEITAAMTAAGLAVQHALQPLRSPRRPLPIGVQVLAAGNREALAVGLAVGAAFIRAENFVFAHVADEGLMPVAEAGPLLRYRRLIGAQHIAIWADVKKKHAAHALTADVTLADTVKAAALCHADAVIITGAATGQPADPRDVADARQAVAATPTPPRVVVGSGVTPDTAAALLDDADALIVGSWLKRAGDWRLPIDPRRARQLVSAARRPPRRAGATRSG